MTADKHLGLSNPLARVHTQSPFEAAVLKRSFKRKTFISTQCHLWTFLKTASRTQLHAKHREFEFFHRFCTGALHLKSLKGAGNKFSWWLSWMDAFCYPPGVFSWSFWVINLPYSFLHLVLLLPALFYWFFGFLAFTAHILRRSHLNKLHDAQQIKKDQSLVSLGSGITFLGCKC